MDEVKGFRWFSGRDTVGAILVEVNGEQCAYIGVSKGISEEVDAQDIRSWGARLPYSVAAALFPGVKVETYSTESI